MRFLTESREPGKIEFGIIYGLMAVLALVAGRFLPITAVAPPCVFKALTGFPCPTCGSTRAVAHLAHADFRSAFAMNPVVCVIVLAAVAVFLYNLAALVFRLSRTSIILSCEEKGRLRAAAVFVTFLNWLYLSIAL